MEIHGYNAGGSIDATIDGFRMAVPDDLASRQRQMIAEWEAKGNTIPPYVAPEPPAPTDLPITRRQLRTALVLAGFPADAIPQAIGQISDPQKRALALIDWEDAPYYVRSHPLFSDPEATAGMGLEPAEIDAMWEAALGLPA